ncbi:MAG: DMT family transporter [Pseudomonadota bacterium]
MTRGPAFGIALATGGAVVLGPDALLMRISGMEALQMTGWRGLCMGSVMWLVWCVTSRTRQSELSRLRGPAGAVLVLAQIGNAILFSLAISLAPVAIVLMGVATVPVFAALLSQLITKERTGLATWVAIAAVLSGIALAVLGETETEHMTRAKVLYGALFGLSTAFVLALNFVTVRARPDLPILPAIGTGALIAGALGWLATGPAEMMQGTLWAILLTGLVILPVSFFTLSLASRYTHAATVSLLMLLETVLGPLWVWLLLDERPGPATLAGGAIVLVALVLYISWMRRAASR